jgi:methylthioribose-1-phosphate isomerase
MTKPSPPSSKARPAPKRSAVVPVRFEGGRLFVLDQTRLPADEAEVELRTVDDAARAISRMVVRGAPLIGVVAAYALALHALANAHLQFAAFEKAFERGVKTLQKTRPTAVNLRWAIERMRAAFDDAMLSGPQRTAAALVKEAALIHREDIEMGRRMSELGADLLPRCALVITVCNTGALATGGWGTALGVIRAAHLAGKLEMSYACETRPRLQGARLTMWELAKEGIPATLITDNAAAYLMSRQRIDAVLTGADRITRRGDVANKIGTYMLAVAAAHHGVPLYVIAPSTSVDERIEHGRDIVIEERDGDEVRRIGRAYITDRASRVWNPAFDVTPAELVSAVVTEKGVRWLGRGKPKKTTEK